MIFNYSISYSYEEKCSHVFRSIQRDRWLGVSSRGVKGFGYVSFGAPMQILVDISTEQ